MKQHEFIWMAKNIDTGTVAQDELGHTAITLRDDILVAHNYKKKDQMTIVFTKDNSQFLIPGKKELEIIFRMHLENVKLEDILMKYCSDNFAKIN